MYVHGPTTLGLAWLLLFSCATNDGQLDHILIAAVDVAVVSALKVPTNLLL